MNHGLWGHALYLASEMDQRTYDNIKMRFVNGLAMNDPLQTLYKLMSGRQPAAVTVRTFFNEVRHS
jgi:predicted transcriptional regulator